MSKLQEIFDTVVNHLRKQRRRSVAHGECLYRVQTIQSVLLES